MTPTITETLHQKLTVSYKRMVYDNDILHYWASDTRVRGVEINKLKIYRSRIKKLPTMTQEEATLLKSYHRSGMIGKDEVNRLLRQLTCTIMLEDLALELAAA